MRWRRRGVSLWVAVAAGTFMPTAGHTVDTKPHVAVRFEIVAPKFKRNLPDRAQAENALAGQVAEHLGQRYPFARWTGGADAAPTLGALVMRLEEQPAAPNPKIVVKWFGSFGLSATNVIALGWQPIDVYTATDPNWDTNNRADFESRVNDALFAKIATDTFDGQVFREFVQQLPIASSVMAAPLDKAIIVPLVWKDVLLSEESTITVRISKSVGAAAERGTLLLGRITERSRDPGMTHVQGCPRTATFAGRDLPVTDCWHPEITDLLNGADVLCYIGEYRAVEHPGTIGPLDLDPK